jgi:hypothetical protein
LAYPSQLLFHEPRKTARPQQVRSGADTDVDWASVEDALDIVRNTRANLLVIGPGSLVMDVVLWAVADEPATIVTPSDGGRLRLPQPSLPRSILVFRDIDELDDQGQASLFAWLESAGHERQIVCTASPSLVSLVRTGTFNRALYYRLNTVCIRLTAS